ncbi:OmpA family protein [Hymenobacter tibetensis]|uniref:OmpA family protein n=1 Tax=Hymenobacter tibetensis TaxID=497967 RepID=A0ABY4D476_9BACT|nr:OmpA family protein [Hymenobacter tibetensis]UOG77188.1 OmpA family protein [Hymenobacter tibetensis]
MKPDKTVVEAVNDCLKPEHISQLATLVSKDRTLVEKGMATLVPLVVRALADRAARHNGLEAVWNLVQQAQTTKPLTQLDTLASTEWNGRGVLLLQNLLHDAYESTTFRLAVQSGVPTASYAQLIEVAVAAVLGTLGHYATTHTLDAASLSGWLQTHNQPTPPVATPAQPSPVPPPPSSRRSLPPPVMANAPKFEAGAGNWDTVGGGSIFVPQQRTKAGLARLGRWKWALLVLPVLLLAYGFFTWGVPNYSTPSLAEDTPVTYTANAAASQPNGATDTGAPVPSGHYDAATDTYIYHTGQPLIITLADGSTQRVGMNSTEYQLYRFLADARQQVDSLDPAVGWINVDRVYFKSGEATLTPESEQQLRNLAAILKTFPRAHILFGGYSDSSGDRLKNLHLSDARAQAAMRALAAQGISLGRLQAIGYGEAYAVASNAAPVGRALNRRLSIKVMTKSAAPLPEPPKAVSPKPTATGLAAQSSSARRASSARQGRKPRQRTKVGRWINNLRQNLRAKNKRNQ